MRCSQLIFSLMLLVLSASTWSAVTGSAFDGNWRINMLETDKVAVRYEEGSGVKGINPGKVTVSVMGLPLPSRAKSRSMSGLPAKDPEVLTCTAMNIVASNKAVQLIYDAGDSETLRKGKYRGRTTKVTREKIEQRYKTSERNVRKTWSLRDDGRLLVAVRIKHKGDKARTYNRVFDRVDPAAGD